jgi:hypothetical protein
VKEEREKPQLCVRLVTDFLTVGPAPTLMPIRRATAPSAPTTTAAQPEHHHPEQRNLPTGLSKPAQRALAAAGYTTLDRLAEISETDLGQLHGIGPKAIEQLPKPLPQLASPTPRRVEPKPE